MEDYEVIGMLRSYVNATLVGMGALKGAPCTIQSITTSGTTHTVTFAWEDSDGDTHTSTLDIEDGEQGETGATGAQGEQGVGISSIEKTGTSGLVDTYTITLSDSTTYTFTVTNGASGDDIDLADLADVTVTSLADGEVLIWDSTTSAWVNSDITIDVDSALSSTSENPVQNKVINTALAAKANTADLAEIATSGDSADASYDNTSSGLSATDAQAAIDELAGEKQDELTFDTEPTSSSTNPVTSGGVYSSEQDVYEYNGVMGAKNLLHYPYLNTTKTFNGITFTDNGDGTVTASGTATSDAYFNCRARTEYGSDTMQDLANGDYILSGCPSGGSASTYRLWLGYGDSSSLIKTLGVDYGSPVSFTNDGEGYALTVQILVKNGVTVSDLIFSPMIRLAQDTDETYQSYAKTNKLLTDEQGFVTDDQYSALETLFS